jgi:hypothetical protein
MRVVAQRADGDCGLAALATLLGMAYEDVYVAARAIDPPSRCKRGMYLKDVQSVARRLGVGLRVKRRPDLEEDEGVLSVLWNAKRRFRGHYVVLWKGLVIDPAGPQVLPWEEWFGLNDGRPGWLLERGGGK